MNTTVQDIYTEAKSNLQDLFGRFEDQLNGQKSKPVHQYRKQAMQDLHSLSFPTRRDEGWKYTSVSRVIAPAYQQGAVASLSKEDIAPFLFPDLDAYTLVFNNGQLDTELSDMKGLPGNITIKTFSEAMEDDRFSTKINKQLSDWLARKDAFTSMNVAFNNQGIFIHVPANTVVDKPVFFLHITDTSQGPVLVNPQHFAVVEKSSELNIVDAYFALHQNETAYFNNILNHFLVADNAKLIYHKLQQDTASAFQVSNSDSEQQRDSVFTAHTIDLGGYIVRNNLRNHLRNSGTMTNMYGVYVGKGQQHIDNQTFIDHAFPHCDSNELYKGVMDDKATGVFNGQVMVRQDAQKTNAFQQNSNLVLSEKATINTKPQLEIYADDVKCSHGATIGQLDENAVFYLRTRGLSEHQSRSLLQQAFVKEVVTHMNTEPVRKQVMQWITDKFDQ